MNSNKSVLQPGGQKPPSLHGQVAVVTGGSRGIGRAVAELYARAGATVIISSRSPDEVAACVAHIGADRAVGVVGDVGDIAFWERMTETVKTLGGGWDILVNCAGASGPISPLEHLALSDWDAVVRTNLTGTMLGCRSAIPFMKARGNGRIINVSSGLAQRRAQQGLAAYSATKAGLVQFSAVLAEELRSDNIEVFALHPGIVETRLSQQHIQEGQIGTLSLGDRLKSIKMLTTDESAAAFYLLASGDVTDLNGTFVQFDDPDVIARASLCLKAIEGF